MKSSTRYSFLGVCRKGRSSNIYRTHYLSVARTASWGSATQGGKDEQELRTQLHTFTASRQREQARVRSPAAAQQPSTVATQHLSIPAAACLEGVAQGDDVWVHHRGQHVALSAHIVLVVPLQDAVLAHHLAQDTRSRAGGSKHSSNSPRLWAGKHAPLRGRAPHPGAN